MLIKADQKRIEVALAKRPAKYMNEEREEKSALRLKHTKMVEVPKNAVTINLQSIVV